MKCVPALNVVLDAGVDTVLPMPMSLPLRNTPSSGELVADVLLCKYTNAFAPLPAVWTFIRNETYTEPLDCDVKVVFRFLNVPPDIWTPLPEIPANDAFVNAAVLVTMIAVLGLSPPVQTASPTPAPPRLPLL